MGRAMQIGSTPKQGIKGFTYIGLMIVVAISGIAMTGVATVWHQDVQREREKQLLFVGDEIRRAITSYYESSPSAAKQYPKSFDDLLIDKRLPLIKHHLRRVYLDPITNSKDWGLVLQQDKIIGVYSKSELKPVKRTGFSTIYDSFSDALSYSDWRFVVAAPVAEPVLAQPSTPTINTTPSINAKTNEVEKSGESTKEKMQAKLQALFKKSN